MRDVNINNRYTRVSELYIVKEDAHASITPCKWRDVTNSTLQRLRRERVR